MVNCLYFKNMEEDLHYRILSLAGVEYKNVEKGDHWTC